MKKIIVIYGPTTSNKLGLTLKLSKHIWGKYHIEPEIVNTDARKVYSGFIISQSLPNKALETRVKLHLFGEVSPRKMISLSQFQKLIESKIFEIQKRGNLPILVGGSSLHLLAVLQGWIKGGKSKSSFNSRDVLIIGTTVSKLILKKMVANNVTQMLRSGLYQEFKKLYLGSMKGRVAIRLLRETLGYKQFLEMARVSHKSPLDLNRTDLIKTEKWIIKDILKYGYHQNLDYKRFPIINKARDSRHATRIVDQFLG